MLKDSTLHNFYSSAAWLQFSSMIREQRFHICELCGRPNAAEVHHLIHLTKENVNTPAVSLNADNVMLLCKHCHYSVHARGKYRARRSFFDAFGNIEKVKEPNDSRLTPLQLSILKEREHKAKLSVKKLYPTPPA